MVDKKISDLDDGGVVASGDLIEIERPGDPASSNRIPLGTAAGHAADDFAGAGDLAAHIADTGNPHGVTKSQVGLGNVSNDAQLKESTFTTRGDLIVRGASAAQRLARGSANTVLTSDGTDPSWTQLSYAMIASGALSGAAGLLAGTASKLLSAGDVKTAVAFQSLSDGANISFDMSAGNNGSVTLGGNRTLANISNAVPLFPFIIKVEASSTTRTLSLGNQYVVASGVESFPISIATSETVFICGFVDTTSRFIITAVVRT